MKDVYKRQVLDDVIKSQGYLNPYILEERQLNVTQLDVFSRLMICLLYTSISADDEDDDDIAVELPEGDISEGPQEIDPRWKMCIRDRWWVGLSLRVRRYKKNIAKGEPGDVFNGIL